jgi:hypothetical protein
MMIQQFKNPNSSQKCGLLFVATAISVSLSAIISIASFLSLN